MGTNLYSYKRFEGKMIENFESKHLKYKKYFGVFIISFVGIVLLICFWALLLPAKVSATTPKSNATDGNLKKIEIKFNKPVNRTKTSASINPDISGQWKYEGQIFRTHLFTKLVFYPDTYLNPEQDYSVKVKSISSLLYPTPNNNYDFNFKAQPLPKIKSSSVSEGQKDVRIDLPINIELDQPNNKIVDYDFVFTPSVDYKKTYSDKNNSYTLEFPNKLLQATEYSITAKRILNGEEVKDNYSLSFTTVGPPGVKSFYPSGNNVLVDTSEFGVIFNQDMDQSQLSRNVTIMPVVLGAWSWDQKNFTLKFKPSEKLLYDHSYSIHINKGVDGNNGNFLSEDINLSFKTIGNVKVSGTSPKNGASGVTPSKIDITFDQKVDHPSAEKAFYFAPAQAGSFSWSGNTLSFAVSGLTNDTTYKFGVAAGIGSIHGLASTNSFDYSFSTKSSETTLNIPMDYQDKPLSCEAASLKMALNYKGATVSETDIMNIVGYDPTIRNGNVWGDPYTAFVGDINGRQDTTGYGVYWDPIARAAKTWRNATAFTGWTSAQAAEQLAAGNPIVVWGVTGGSIARDDWVTSSGKNILAWHGEHARTLIGFKGTTSNPTSFILNDPVSGRITWTKSQFESNWSSFGNAGVVVY